MAHFEPPIGIHDQLNPLLWDGEQLDPEVQIALLRIAREFYDFLGVNAKIRDIVISGSQANYNYSKFSDIDLHLIMPIGDIECDEPIDALFDTKRKLWKAKHNIQIHGVPVELYAEDESNPAVSSSYSLITNKWINIPDAPIIDYNKEEVHRLVNVWTLLIDRAVGKQNLAQCEKLSTMLTSYRKLGLKIKGEFGVPNLVFKSLRNSGTVSKLMAAINDLKDDLLSLD